MYSYDILSWLDFTAKISFPFFRWISWKKRVRPLASPTVTARCSSTAPVERMVLVKGSGHPEELRVAVAVVEVGHFGEISGKSWILPLYIEFNDFANKHGRLVRVWVRAPCQKHIWVFLSFHGDFHFRGLTFLCLVHISFDSFVVLSRDILRLTANHGAGAGFTSGVANSQGSYAACRSKNFQGA